MIVTAKTIIMATVKKTKSVSKKTAAPKRKPVKKKAQGPIPIVKANEDALKKLRALKVEQGLQNDIQWCLGSYSYDKNPAGLFEMGAKALKVFRDLKSLKPKSVPATLVKTLEMALVQ
jgi:hypothetical protein